MHLPVVQWKQWHWILFNKDWKYTWNEDYFTFSVFVFCPLSIVAVHAVVYMIKIKALMRTNGKRFLVNKKINSTKNPTTQKTTKAQ